MIRDAEILKVLLDSVERFVQERLVNMVLATESFQSKACNMYALPGSVTPLNNFMPQAVQANALKFAYAHIGDQVYLDAYQKLRDEVWRESGMDVLAQLRHHLQPCCIHSVCTKDE